MSEDVESVNNEAKEESDESSCSGEDSTPEEPSYWHQAPEFHHYWQHYEHIRKWFAGHNDAVASHGRGRGAYCAQLQQQQQYHIHCAQWYDMCLRCYAGAPAQPGSQHTGRGRSAHGRGNVRGRGGMQGHPNQRHPGHGYSRIPDIYTRFYNLPQPGHSPHTDKNLHSQNNHQGKRKNRRKHGTQKQKKRRTGKSGHHSGHHSEDEDEEQYVVEFTPDMLSFFEQSAKHRQERDAKRKQEEEDNPEIKEEYTTLGEETCASRAKTSAPTERPGVRRTAEMQWLYGGGAAMIHGMETAMQLTYDRNNDKKDPKLWPNLPLNIKFK